MLNLGLIGDIKLLEPYIKKAKDNPEILITGKSSVGTQPSPESFRLKAPEFNRIELIERSDILFINRFSLIPYDLLCEMVKKSKHFLAVTYPDLTTVQFTHLMKLAHEAKTIIQVANPFYYLPAIQWLSANLKKPAYVNVSSFNHELADENMLLKLLLMLSDLTGTMPKKTTAALFRSNPVNFLFHNVQLEFGDGSVINLEYGISQNPEQFKLKVYMHNAFAEMDLMHEKYLVNNKPLHPSEIIPADETETFLNSVLKKSKPATNIDTYINTLQILKIISEKLDRYSSV